MRCCQKTVAFLLATSVLALCAGTVPARAGVSAIAGEEAPNVERRVTVGNPYMYEIEWLEKADKPCSFTVAFRANAPTAPVGPTLSMQLCNSPNSGSRRRVLALPFTQEQTVPAGGHVQQSGHVTGLRVCLNARRTRLKGLQMFYREKERNVSRLIGDERSTRTAKHFNCKHWSPRVSCPVNEKADGLDFYHVNGAITGLRLVCSGV